MPDIPVAAAHGLAADRDHIRTLDGDDAVAAADDDDRFLEDGGLFLEAAGVGDDQPGVFGQREQLRILERSGQPDLCTGQRWDVGCESGAEPGWTGSTTGRGERASASVIAVNAVSSSTFAGRWTVARM